MLIDLTPLELTIFTGLIGIVIYLFKAAHNQAMSKLDKLIETVSGLTSQMAKHDLKLETGESEFTKIEAHQKEQDAKIQELTTKVTLLESKNLLKHKNGELNHGSTTN